MQAAVGLVCRTGELFLPGNQHLTRYGKFGTLRLWLSLLFPKSYKKNLPKRVPMPSFISLVLSRRAPSHTP